MSTQTEKGKYLVVAVSQRRRSHFKKQDFNLGLLDSRKSLFYLWLKTPTLELSWGQGNTCISVSKALPTSHPKTEHVISQLGSAPVTALGKQKGGY